MPSPNVPWDGGEGRDAGSRPYGRYRAKKTNYHGTWYDSMLEAKVAEAMDDLGIVHEYHRQAFRDRSFPYGQYTPDFHVPDYRKVEGWAGDGPLNDMYVEVCGVFDERHRGNVEALAAILGKDGAVAVIDGDGRCTTYCMWPDGAVRAHEGWPEPLVRVARAVARDHG